MPITMIADTLGFEAGTAFWKASNRGVVQSTGTKIDLQDDLGHQKSQDTTFFWAILEHPIPVIPNIKIVHSLISSDANKAITQEIVFAGQTYRASAQVESELTLNQTDFMFYYEILDNIVELDIGLNIKHLQGEAILKSQALGLNEKETISAPIPMLYAKGRVNVPFSGLSAGVEGSYLKIANSKALDYRVEASYSKKIAILDIGGVLGYRNLNILIDTDDTYVDLEYKGPYLGMFLHF
jgi:outer membrane protein